MDWTLEKIDKLQILEILHKTFHKKNHKILWKISKICNLSNFSNFQSNFSQNWKNNPLTHFVLQRNFKNVLCLNSDIFLKNLRHILTIFQK